MNLKKIIREDLGGDDLDWIRNSSFDPITATVNFFIPGKYYYMLKTLNPGSVREFKYAGYEKVGYDEICLYFDGGCGSYTPEYIVRKLKEHNLTLYDLVVGNDNITESEDDDLDWIRDVVSNPIDLDSKWVIHAKAGNEPYEVENWLRTMDWGWPIYNDEVYENRYDPIIEGEHERHFFNVFDFRFLRDPNVKKLPRTFDAYGNVNGRGVKKLLSNGYNIIEWSDIKNYLQKENINESEDDDLDWIRGVGLTVEQILNIILTKEDPKYIIDYENGVLGIWDDTGRYFGVNGDSDSITLEDVLMEAKKEYEFCIDNNVPSHITSDYKFIYDQIRDYLNVNESIKILNSIKIFINEDGKTEPDMVWDFPEVKKKLDLSKKWVKTKEDVVKYLNLLLDRFRSVPYKIRLKIFKYITYSFLGILTLNQIVDVEEQVKNGVDRIELKAENIINKAKKIFKKETKIRKPSEKLIDHLKWEEGSITRKGEPVLTAYDLGDGAYTIGYGHAVFSDPSRGDNGGKYDFLPKYDQIVPGKTKITPKEAEILLRDDVGVASEALNEILNDWESKGIKPKITQNMYDAMVSMIFNMGRGGFRQTKFIQLVKRGKLKSAKEQIKKESEHMFDKYPGLKTRREKESKLFSGHE